MKLFINECNMFATWIFIMIERILWLVMSFLNIINIIKVTLANGVKKEKKAIVNPNLLGRASKFLVRSLNNII